MNNKSSKISSIKIDCEHVDISIIAIDENGNISNTQYPALKIWAIQDGENGVMIGEYFGDESGQPLDDVNFLVDGIPVKNLLVKETKNA